MYPEWMEAAGSTVLWRMFSDKGTTTARAHAVILPGGPPHTLAFFANDEMDRVENYETMDLALFRADEIRGSLLAEDWKED